MVSLSVMGGLLAGRRVRAAERIVVGLYVLAAVFVMGREIVGKVADAVPAPSPSVVGTTRPTAPPSSATTAITPTPTVAVAATPSPSPQPTPDPVVVTPYQNGVRRFAALTVPAGYTLRSPLSGKASVVVYQFLGGEVRIGSNMPGEPFYPYITITSADRKLILRPGALIQDVQLVVRDGQTVTVGSSLFTITGQGASSWRTFYDRSVTAQVIASVAALPSGVELDPVPLFKR
jgi:hypothetical protein